MKTRSNHNQGELVKRLFRQLFELQIKLEKVNEFDADPSLRRIIASIDKLLETLLDNSID